MATPLLQIDAFTGGPFAGNPAAVCLLDGPADGAWMQSLAAEMNLSETAFLHPEGDVLRLRWFTPAAEVELCGHATWCATRASARGGALRVGVRGDRVELGGRAVTVFAGELAPAAEPPG